MPGCWAPNQLEQSVTGDKSITIYPSTPQKVKDYQQLVVRTFFLANADVKTVAFSIKTLLKAKDVVTDERLGIITLRVRRKWCAWPSVSSTCRIWPTRK